jgi:hypothetical protein
MSAKTVWISEYRWRQLPRDLRRRVLEAMDRPKSGVVPEYAGNIESALHARGEHGLAFELLDAIEVEILQNVEALR